MSGIKRIGWHGVHGMQDDANGDYVLHSDHEAEVARLRAEVEGLRRTEARYRWLQKQTPYRFGKIQAACVIDAVDTLYFKADEFDRQLDAAMGEGE